jgi:MFS family permease
MASYYVVARSFSAAAFSTMAASILGIGSLGNIGAAFPLTLLVELFGWRFSIMMIAMITLVIAGLCYLIVKDPPKVITAQKGSVLDLLRIRAMWFILPMVLVNYAPAAGLRGLWIGPYFTDVFGSNIAQIGTVTTVMALAMIAGNFFYGPLDRLFRTRKWVIFFGNLSGATLCVSLYFFGGNSFWTAAGIMAGIGFFGASYPILVAHGRSFFPEHLVGRGVTLINLFCIGGVGVMQNLSGHFYNAKITETMSPILSYNAVILLFCVTMLLGLAIYLCSQDRTD